MAAGRLGYPGMASEVKSLSANHAVSVNAAAAPGDHASARPTGRLHAAGGLRSSECPYGSRVFMPAFNQQARHLPTIDIASNL